MSAADVVADGRRAAEALMADSCRIRRPGETVTDPDTGVVTPGYTDVYRGVCKFQQTLAQSSTATAGEHVYTVQGTRLDLPVTAGPVEVDDTVDAVVSSLDPQLEGRVYRVVELFHKSYATAQRVRVEEITG